METTTSKIIFLYNKKLEVIKLDELIKSEETREIVAFSNYLQTIPEELAEYYPNVMKLDFWNNRLSVLPEGFDKFKNLQGVKLSCNQLSYLPESFGNLVNLENCFLGVNNLKSYLCRFQNWLILRSYNCKLICLKNFHWS